MDEQEIAREELEALWNGSGKVSECEDCGTAIVVDAEMADKLCRAAMRDVERREREVKSGAILAALDEEGSGV